MELQSDCQRCAGLCCAAFHFDAGPEFADDKAAGESCRHLTASHRCTIHASRPERGYSGCLGYECLGAGQAATALFPPAQPAELAAVRHDRFEAFRILRTIHALAVALQRPELPAALVVELDALLQPEGGWSYAALLEFDRSSLRSEILKRIAAALRATAVPAKTARGSVALQI